jgi:two-component system KDP operon response regulator KdpE
MSNPPDCSAAAHRARILLIDDEPQIRKFVDISLRSQGYATLLAGSGGEGLTLLASKGADLVVLDLGLPDQDGKQVLAELRQWSRVPVIVLTVRADESEKVALLDAGANDYVTKPFGVEELLARIRAVLRMSAPASHQRPIYDDGNLCIDFAATLDGETLALSRKEFALLTLLARQPGRLLTQAHLLQQLWGPSHQHDSHYLRILVGKLRHKLGDSAAAPRYIITEAGVGLRFVGSEQRRSV